MAQWHTTPTSLTLFGPLSSEESQSSGFFSKIWKKTKDDASQSPSSGGSQKSSNEPSREVSEERDNSFLKRTASLISTSSVSERRDEDEQENYGNQEKFLTSHETIRTLSSVLTRLSNILERRTSTPQAYKDSDFKQYWMPDSSCKECYDCGDKFTTFRRRHHCRICGQIFCSKCCNQELPGKIIGYKGGIRVCTYCGKVALSALQTEPTGNVHVEREDLGLSIDSEPQNYEIWGTQASRMTPDKGPRNIMDSSVTSLEAAFDITPQSEYSCSEHFDNIDRKILEDSVQLRELWRQIQDTERGVEMQNHRIKLSTYRKCIMGYKLVDWLLKNDKVAQRLQAVAIGQALLDSRYLEPIAGQPMLFHDDFSLYRPSETSPVDPPVSELEESEAKTELSTEPEWFKEIQTDNDLEYYSASEENAEHRMISTSITSKNSQGTKTDEGETNLDFEPLPRQELQAPNIPDDLISDSMFTSSQTVTAAKLTSNRGWRYIEALKEENCEKLAYTRLKKAHVEHLNALASQMLSEEGLSKSWSTIVLGISERISHYVHPDIKMENDHMDVRKYVKFKKIPGGNKEQTCLVHGLVFTKNIAHKKMASQITNPNVLLLRGSIEYQRVESKFSSLEPQILQEDEFLRKNIAKISSLDPKPDIVVVEKSVSRLAQDYLLSAGITLIYNVKMAVMERLERFTQGSIVASIDGIISGPIRMGFCHNFKVCNFSLPSGENKTMLCFDGCATHLGCTVTLRGGSSGELKRLKKIMKFMIYAAYNCQLEISFCMDEFALPQTGPSENLADHLKSVEFSTYSEEIHQPSEENNAVLSESTNGNSENSKPTNEFLPVCDNDDRDEIMLQTVESELSTLPKSENLNVNETKGEKQDSSEKEGEMESCEESSLMQEVEVLMETTSPADQGKNDNEEGSVCETNSSPKRNVGESENTVKSGDVEMCVESENTYQEQNSERNDGEGGTSTEKIKFKQKSQGIVIQDESDPLHNYQKNKDDTIFYSSETLQEKTLKHCQKFKRILDEVLLSTSPYISYEPPYLQSEEGWQCGNRKFLPEEVYWSQQFKPQSYQQRKRQKIMESSSPVKNKLTWSKVEVVEAHPLILGQLTSSLNDKHTQSMLADYRARGGRIKLKPIHQENGTTPMAAVDRHRKSIPNNQGKAMGEEDSPQKTSKMRDCFEFSRHQRFAVLLSSHSEKSANHPYPCLPPQIVTMEFYGSQDITLGGFLEKFCFRESYSLQPYTCPSVACDVPMLDHVRRIVHGNGAIYISLRKLINFVPGGEKAIMLWNWCRKCRQATPLVPMSMDSWNLSFAKYLELRFHGNSFVRRVGTDPCSHSLHHFYSQYFGHRNIVATFKYYPITKKEIGLPPRIVSLDKGMLAYHRSRLKEEVVSLAHRSRDLYRSITSEIDNNTTESMPESLSKLITDYKSIIHTEQARMWEAAENLREKLSDLWREIETQRDKDHSDKVPLLYLLQDDLVKMKRLMADAVLNWNSKLQELYTQQKKHFRNIQQMKKDRELAGSQPSLLEEDSKMAGSLSSKSSLPEDISLSSSPSSSSIVHKESSDPVAIGKVKESSHSSNGTPTENEVHFSIREDYTLSVESDTYSVTPGITAGIMGYTETKSKTTSPVDSKYILLQLFKGDDLEPSGEKGNMTTRSSDLTVAPAKEMEENFSDEENVKSKAVATKPNRTSHGGNFRKQGSADDLLDGQQTDRIYNFKKTLSTFLSGVGNTAFVLPFDASEHHQLPVGKVPILVYDQEPSSIIAYALSCHDYHGRLQEIQISISHTQKENQSQSSNVKASGKTMDTDLPGQEGSDLGKRGSQGVLSFLRGSSKENSPKLQRRGEVVDTVKYTPKSGGENSEIEEQDGFTFLTASMTDTGEKSKSGKQLASPHIELQFSDNTAKFYCKVYYAEQFRQLRKLIFPAGEEILLAKGQCCILKYNCDQVLINQKNWLPPYDIQFVQMWCKEQTHIVIASAPDLLYIRSLSRCKLWEAKGGKSGSTFCKTDDTRFILKQMSSTEVDIFEKFGPEYFQYISKTYQEQKPTALAKIVGVYKIGFRNSQTNHAMKQDLLVVENLFYNRKISQTFDLKGSMRNRLVNTSGKREEELVLLDENLLKLSVDSPLYIYPHSKAVLFAAIRHDSEFLAANFVMDYSLLVGMDETKRELVVGIIDYIRTFTWDKKLETLLKSTGGRMPTVVSPDIYRNRFLEAMSRYFPPVPDQWSGLGKDVDY